MFIKTPVDGYHFSNTGITKIAEMYKAKYLGYWSIRRESGWTDEPVDVFYQSNPDTSKGHSHYFGMFVTREGKAMITNAESAFSEPIVGIQTSDGEVIISRYRHDYVTKEDYMIDGGRDYVRSTGGPMINVTVVDGEFVFNVP